MPTKKYKNIKNIEFVCSDRINILSDGHIKSNYPLEVEKSGENSLYFC